MVLFLRTMFCPTPMELKQEPLEVRQSKSLKIRWNLKKTFGISSLKLIDREQEPLEIKRANAQLL